MLIHEFDHLIEMDQTGIATYQDEMGMGERIREWFDTPQNTLVDKPGWGHNLATLKHEPTGPDLNVMAEMLIIEKLRFDIQNLVITGVSVEFLEIDRCYIVIDFTMGRFAEEIAL